MIVGSLAVNITANVSKFTSGLKQARSQLSEFASQITAWQGVVAGVVAGTVATFIKSTIDQGTALLDTSTKLGVTTDALQKMRYVADQLGASQETMERSLGFLNKTLGNAANGSTEALQAFERLGLNVNQLKNQSIDQTFIQVAEAIRQIPDAAQQGAAAVAVFGKAGQDMLPVIRAGAAEMERLVKYISQAGGITTEAAIKKLEAMGDQLSTIKTQVTAISMEFVATFGPAIAYVLDTIVDRLKVMKEGLTALDKYIAFVERFYSAGGNAGMISAFGQPPKPGPTAAASTNPYAGGQFGAMHAQNLQGLFNMLVPGAKANQLQNMLGVGKGVTGAFGEIGKLLGGASNIQGGMIAGVVKALERTPVSNARNPFSLYQHGSADAQRQQAAIRREAETTKVAKQALKVEEKQLTVLEKILGKGGLAPANLF